jgi:hypothetical protein
MSNNEPKKRGLNQDRSGSDSGKAKGKHGDKASREHQSSVRNKTTKDTNSTGPRSKDE